MFKFVGVYIGFYVILFGYVSVVGCLGVSVGLEVGIGIGIVALFIGGVGNFRGFGIWKGDSFRSFEIE